MKSVLYLDHNATTAVKPSVADAVTEAMGVVGNASSVHGPGRAVRRIIENARDKIAVAVNARPERVIFTASGTEANNMALQNRTGERVLVSAVEHPSVRNVVDHDVITVDGQGRAKVDGLSEKLLELDKPALVSVMLANNETGVIQPVKDIVRIAKSSGAMVHCDAVQGFGKMDVNMVDLGVDMLTLSAHKIGGPQGVGALVLAPGVEIKPLIKGGGQEHRLRAGTENVPGIAGFGEAAALAARELAEFAKLARLRDQLEEEIYRIAGIKAYGKDALRIVNTSYLSMPGVSAETQTMAFDLEGIAVSSGSACSSGKVETSHVLKAMGVPDAGASSAVRVSLGWTTTQQDIERFTSVWKSIYNRLGQQQNSARDLAEAV